MKRLYLVIFALLLASCSAAKQVIVPTAIRTPMSGSAWLQHKVDQMNSELKQERPVHKGELNLEDFHANMFVTRYYGKISPETVLILSNVYYLDGVCRLNTIAWDEDWPYGKFYEEDWCANYGVVPYNDVMGLNGWNTAYAMPSYMESLTPAQFDALKVFLIPAP